MDVFQVFSHRQVSVGALKPGNAMELIIAVILVGLIPAAIARSKGRSFFLWWIYGSAILIVALPHVLLVKRKMKALERRALREGHKKCPRCAELIKREALICRYCQFRFDGD